jgi:hypothetical protein
MWEICCCTTAFQITQHLNGRKHTANIAGLRDQPGMQSVIGESSAISSFSAPSKFATSMMDLSICVQRLIDFQNK